MDGIFAGQDYESRLVELASLIKKQQNETAKLRRSFEDGNT